MKNVIAVFFVVSAMLFACKSSKDASAAKGSETMSTKTTWIIASEQIQCDASSEALCYQVKPQGAMDYENMDVFIENFDFEPGYKYQIQLNIIPSKNGEIRYEMIKQLFKVAVN